MPSSEQFPGTATEEDEEESESMSPPGSPYLRGSINNRSRPGSVNSRRGNMMGSRPNSGTNQHGVQGRPMSSMGPGQSRSLSLEAGGQKHTNMQRSAVVSFIKLIILPQIQAEIHSLEAKI